MNVYSKISQNLTNLGHIIKIHFQFFNLKMIKIIIKVLLRNFFFVTTDWFSVYQDHMKKNSSDDFILYLDLFHLNVNICEEARDWTP